MKHGNVPTGILNVFSTKCTMHSTAFHLPHFNKSWPLTSQLTAATCKDHLPLFQKKMLLILSAPTWWYHHLVKGKCFQRWGALRTLMNSKSRLAAA